MKVKRENGRAKEKKKVERGGREKEEDFSQEIEERHGHNFEGGKCMKEHQTKVPIMVY